MAQNNTNEPPPGGYAIVCVHAVTQLPLASCTDLLHVTATLEVPLV